MTIIVNDYTINEAALPIHVCMDKATAARIETGLNKLLKEDILSITTSNEEHNDLTVLLYQLTKTRVANER